MIYSILNCLIILLRRGGLTATLKTYTPRLLTGILGISIGFAFTVMDDLLEVFLRLEALLNYSISPRAMLFLRLSPLKLLLNNI